MDTSRPLFDQAVAAAQDYLASAREGRVGPTDDERAALAQFSNVSLDDPIGAHAALELIDQVGGPATMRSTGGRYFGFVNGGVTDEALAASIIASAWDQNVALPAMSPAASAIDAAASALIVDALGLAPTATAAFCAGATIANITGIVTARDALLERQGWDVHERGLRNSPPISVVISAEAHVSVHKALRIAGFGQDEVHVVAADQHGALDASQLPTLTGPVLVLAQAGNVNTGHSDPFNALAEAYDESWMHIDGAFGLWANAVPERRHFVAGVARADSWATDAHKWLNAPYDCGVLVCADGRHLSRSMRMDAAYVPSGGEDRTLMNLGLQMSQAARAVPVWAVLASRGRHDVAERIEHSCQCAERFGDRLREAGAELLAPVVINQALVAFGDDDTTDRVVDAVQAGGVCWMGATTWQGRRAMRISVSDFATGFDEVDVAVDEILRVWRDLS